VLLGSHGRSAAFRGVKLAIASAWGPSGRLAYIFFWACSDRDGIDSWRGKFPGPISKEQSGRPGIAPALGQGALKTPVGAVPLVVPRWVTKKLPD